MSSKTTAFKNYKYTDLCFSNKPMTLSLKKFTPDWLAT
jgi:hypothetical protein